MFTLYLVVVLVTATGTLAAAVADFLRTEWILGNMRKYGLPKSWIHPLGAVKAAGALGLLAGFAVPALGIAAAAGLVLYFAGAMLTVARARWYAHLVYPGVFLLLATGSLALRLIAP
ncbi:DoxX family protein [Amycolatopsis cihanbeyliensis]|uniref:DoxX-like protein n=1 Tax=Amycolatopsis cihanbeyliensis TaxID=1128664 RepID=A0A542DGT4_AMYCI|nr:DoxX family protein [Amycolatopsis cihanbeyliensis]TQJ02272.1 DoxX-like protein [Amycolatopsis cihanbeyliensis]